MTWSKTETEAIRIGLARCDRRVDPELLAARARAAGIKLPITRERVSSPSMSSSPAGAIGYAVAIEDLPKLAALVDRLIAEPSKRGVQAA